MPDRPPARRWAWLTSHIPTRESIQHNRVLKPFAPHLTKPQLWRLTRRSVPRGVALGLTVGVIIPIMHTAIAALLAIPLRANVAVAAGTTLVINPLTIPPLYYAAYKIGGWELHHDALVDPAAAEQFTSELSRFLFLAHHASGPIALGILNIAVAVGVIGYFVSSVVWTAWQRRRLERRRIARRGRA